MGIWMLLGSVSTGIGVGILSGLVGIGGGVILVPILLYMYNMRMEQAAGTSLAIVIPTALAGVVAHWTRGNVDLKLTLLLAAGGVVGSVLGTRLGVFLPESTIKRVFALLLVVVAIKLFLDAGSATVVTATSSIDNSAT